MNAVLAQLAELGHPAVTAADLSKLGPVDEFDVEIVTMSQVRGYFEVSDLSSSVVITWDLRVT